MALNVVCSDDLQPVPSDEGDGWLSTGSDPFFNIRFGAMRDPFVVAYLVADSDMIDPKIYVKRGRRYHENDTTTAERGRAFIILADVGAFGLIRSFRVDPSSFPCRFRFSAESFTDRETAERAIAARIARDMPDASFVDLGRLPRFPTHLRLPRIHSRKAAIGRFARTHYALADEVADVAVPEEGMWLSVVVPVYNAPKRYLDDLVKSFVDQSFPGVELILSDDASTDKETLNWYRDFSQVETCRIVRNAVNGGIAAATNAGLMTASGTWVALLDHDDVIAPHAFKMIARTLGEHPDASFIYTDELVVNDRLQPSGLMLKPAYDPVLLTGVNYINHFSIYRRERLEEIGFLRTGFDGSQDYDLLLRYLEGIPERQVLHLPYPAYWWRRTGQTFSRRFVDKAMLAARTALVDRFAREGKAITVEPALTHTLHRVAFQNPTANPAEAQWPKISVIIPSRNGLEMIRMILSGLFEKTDYPDLEVIVIDNGSTDPRVLELYRDYERLHSNFSVTITPEKFNFARAVNRGMKRANGDHFLILNNDVEVIDGGWLKEMVSCLQFSATGIVGAKLLYPNRKIQHAGVIAGFGGLAGHWYLDKPADFGGPMNRLHVRNSMTCVTGAVMLISGTCAAQVGGWDEVNFAIAYNDVDYCLRAHKAGFRIIWTPFACLYHHESASRGSDLMGERKRRFEQEKDNLRRIHDTETFEDPAINPGYERSRSTPGYVRPTKVAKARIGIYRG